MYFRYFWHDGYDMSIGVIKANSKEEAREIASCVFNDDDVEIDPINFNENGFMEVQYGSYNGG